MAGEQPENGEGRNGDVKEKPKTVVERIRVTLVTGDVPDAATNGEVYLTTGAREFNIKRPDIDDRQRGARDVYRLGAGANIDNAARNNPTGLPTWMLGPIGLRFEPQTTTPAPDTWNLASAKVEVLRDDGVTDVWDLDPSLEGLWLGRQTTLTVWLIFL